MSFKQYVKIGIGLSVGFYLGDTLMKTVTRHMFYLLMDNSSYFKTYVEHAEPHVYYKWQRHNEAVESVRKPIFDENE